MKKSKLRVQNRLESTEGIDPLSGVFNLVDVMLVFSCGLMVALILNWGVRLKQVKLSFIEQQEIQEDIEELPEDRTGFSEGEGYEEMGLVYRDPDTGKLYLMKED